MEEPGRFWTIGPACGATARTGKRGFRESSFMLSDYSARAAKGYLCFMAVADGFGGPELGETASRMACEIVHAAMDPNRYEDEAAFRHTAEQHLAEAGTAANRHLYSASSAPGKEAMGTTLTCAAIDSENAIVAHVGNNRAYVLTARGTRQVTSDHVEIGADGAKRLTRALGVSAAVDADLLRVPLRPGEVFFICTHGLYSTLSSEELAGAFMTIADLQAACDWLAETAVARGASGDVIVTAWRVPGDVPVVVAPQQQPAKDADSKSERPRGRRWLVALIAVLLLLAGAVGGWFIASIFYQDKGATKNGSGTTSTARFAVGDIAVVDTTGRPEACYLTDYPDGPEQTRLYDGWKVRIISEKFTKGEQWYRVEVMDGGLAADGKEGYVEETFLVEAP